MSPIMEIARRHRLLVIEDAAQAHGAEYNKRRAGSIGDLGCFSFYPGKNLGAYGEAGAVVCDDPGLAHRIALLRDWGQETKYNHVLPGYNYRMDGIQGAILNVKLNYIESWTEARRSIASIYDRVLSGGQYQRPALSPLGSRHVFHVYAIAVEKRDDVQRALQAAGIGTGIHYPIPVHLQTAYAGLARQPNDLPVTESLAKRFLSLPIYAELQPDQVSAVAQALKHACVFETA